jgi:hypothetical protein
MYLPPSNERKYNEEVKNIDFNKVLFGTWLLYMYMYMWVTRCLHVTLWLYAYM